MDAEKKRLRDEVSELTEAVRALRDELASERLARAAHHCHCAHPVWVYPNAIYPPYYPAVYTVSGGGGYVQYSAALGAAGANTTYALSQGN